MPSRSLFALALLATLTAASPGALGAAPRRELDAYVLYATESLRLGRVTVAGGDLGVSDGRLIAGSGLDASGSQLVAGTMRLGRGARCAGRYGGATSGPSGCPSAGVFAGAPVPDAPARCDLPAPAAACDAARDVEVRDGATHRLGGGIYGSLAVDNGAVELSGGHYVFCDLSVGRRGAVRFLAPAEIDVAGRVRLKGGASAAPATDVVLAPADVRLRAGAKGVMLGTRTRLAASLCVPEGDIRLRGATFDGTAVARRIRASGATVRAPWVETREPCAARNPRRNAYFGDLHVHTKFSFDVRIFGASTSVDESYRFARGESLLIAPNDGAGNPTRPVRLDRPLDFAAVTDHSEFLGEVETCSVPGTPGYDSVACQQYRAGGFGAFVALGASLFFGTRDAETCGPDGSRCTTLASEVWQRVRDAAEAVYDRTATCGFTSLLGYEFTAVGPTVSTLHRNVFFRNERVPALPVTYFEARNRAALWTALRDQCVRSGQGCDVLAIPHNANESNGRAFLVEYPGATTIEEERALATLGGSMEPLLEIFQHKGDGECMNGLSGILGAPDELCDFEKRLRAPDDCGDGTGSFGAQDMGCISRRDFARGALLEGLGESERLGVNPFRLGFVASTDTHNGTSGAVREDEWAGHQGENDATEVVRLGNGVDDQGALGNDPGGLAGIWAEENTRASLFDALRRRETFGTSGPRIAVRFFAGYGLDPGACTDPDMVRNAYARGVPMGGVLGAPPSPGAAPTFLVAALRDPGTAGRPGTPLQRIQIVKGWRAGGQRHVSVFDVAGDTGGSATVDLNTCEPVGAGADSLCAVWTDPEFDPAVHAWYYARVVENPTCRWSTWDCLRLPPEARPASCSDPAVPKTIQERAWSSPVWIEAPGG